MKATLLILAILASPALANFPVKQSQTWQVTEDKIYVSNQNEVSWEIEHTCSNSIAKEDKVSIVVNQSRVRKNSQLELVVNGHPQMCQVERIRYLR
jgi:predicted secreted protein